MPGNEFTSDSGRFDKEALVALIDSRFNHNIERWYTLYWQPMHLENRADLSAIKNIVSGIVDKMNQAQGGMTVADKVMTGLGAIGLLALSAFIGHIVK